MEQGNIFNVDPMRTRKYYFTRDKAFRVDIVKRAGVTVIPLRLYLNRGRDELEGYAVK